MLSKASTYVTKGLKCFALKKFAAAHQYFERAVKLPVDVFPRGEQAPAEAARARCLLCRLQMYACLHLNNFFLDELCHLYVVGLEVAALYLALANSDEVLLCLAVSNVPHANYSWPYFLFVCVIFSFAFFARTSLTRWPPSSPAWPPTRL